MARTRTKAAVVEVAVAPALETVTPARPGRNLVASARHLVAAAARITGTSGNRPKGNGLMSWQMEAWDFYGGPGVVGELAYVVNWKANAMSRVTLRLMHIEDDGTHVEVADPGMIQLLHDLVCGQAGQRQMMSTATVHLEVPGESYLVGVTQLNGQTDVWRILSDVECKLDATGQWTIDRGDGKAETYPDDNKPREDGVSAMVYRIWRPDPMLYVNATSPTKGALPVLRRMNGLDKMIDDGIDSRLAGAGVLLVPAEMSFETPIHLLNEDGTSSYDPTSLDDFLALLTEAMLASMADQGDVSARVPIIVKAPGQYLAAFQHLTFDTPFSAQTLELQTAQIRRLALVLDVPPEILLGMGDVNHWTGWLVSDDAITTHIEPLAELLTNGFTEGYLWPMLQGKAETLPPDARRYYIDGDTSELRQRPNRATEAMDLHKRMVISDAALLREVGFDESDRPDAIEVARRLLLGVAMGTVTPDLAAAALAQLGAPLEPAPSVVPGQERHPAEGDTVPTADPAHVTDPTAPAPATAPAHAAPPVPSRGDKVQAAALLAVSEQMVFRGVERANNRVNNRAKVRRPVEASKLDAALADAWEHVPRAAALLGIDPQLLESTLDGYARDMLTSAADHDPLRLAALLGQHVFHEPDAVAAA